jgi:hypothetical protein
VVESKPKSFNNAVRRRAFEWRFSRTKDGLTVRELMFYRTVMFYACGFEYADDLAEDADVA